MGNGIVFTHGNYIVHRSTFQIWLRPRIAQDDSFVSEIQCTLAWNTLIEHNGWVTWSATYRMITFFCLSRSLALYHSPSRDYPPRNNTDICIVFISLLNEWCPWTRARTFRQSHYVNHCNARTIEPKSVVSSVCMRVLCAPEIENEVYLR